MGGSERLADLGSPSVDPVDGDPVWDRIADIAALIYTPSTGYVERAGERGLRVYVLDPLPQTDRGRRQW